MVTKCKQSTEKHQSSNLNEIAQRKITSLKNVTVLENHINSFDPNSVNDLFTNSLSKKKPIVDVRSPRVKNSSVMLQDASFKEKKR